LAKFLSDHLRRSLRVEKAVANHLPHQFVGAAIVAFRSARLTAKRIRTVLLVSAKELGIALSGVPVLAGRFSSSQSFTLSFNQHSEFLGDFILIGNGQSSVLADQLLGLLIPLHLLASLGQTAIVMLTSL
jgi:hypothetical protein